MEMALNGNPYPPSEPKLTDEQEAYLVAFRKDAIVMSISANLKKNNLKPWLIKSWCIVTITPLFIS
jgi:hypothetical protein